MLCVILDRRAANLRDQVIPSSRSRVAHIFQLVALSHRLQSILYSDIRVPKLPRPASVFFGVSSFDHLVVDRHAAIDWKNRREVSPVLFFAVFFGADYYFTANRQIQDKPVASRFSLCGSQLRSVDSSQPEPHFCMDVEAKIYVEIHRVAIDHFQHCRHVFKHPRFPFHSKRMKSRQHLAPSE
jgi:hypothetical protein